MASGKPDQSPTSSPTAITRSSRRTPRKLRKTLRPALAGEPDPVARAEEALAAISGDFSQWMHDECARLDAARRKVRDSGLSTTDPPGAVPRRPRREGRFRHARLSGGRARPPTACAGCLEHTPDLTKIPLAIVDQHVDAVRAIVREHDRADMSPRSPRR